MAPVSIGACRFPTSQAEKLRLEVEKEQLILQAEKLQDKEVRDACDRN